MKAVRLFQLFAGASTLALASAAAAQTAAPAPASNEVVVTGSRVIKNGNNMPSPVTVVNVEQMEDFAPGPVALAIEELPSLAGSRTNTANPGLGTTNAEAFVFNLRNLGYGRQLVMFDGNRLPPATYDQLVDVAMVPQMLLQRADVVTGGVSAVYGSDAISGVVNFITDSKFNGLKIQAAGSETQYGDDQTASFGVAVGTRLLNDRGHFELSYEYRHDPGILYRTERPWGAADWAMVGLGTAASPFYLIQNTRFSLFTSGGLISAATGAGAALNGQMFAQNGVLSPFIHGIITPSAAAGGYESGGSGAVHDGSAATKLDSGHLFGRFDYDLTDNVHGYVEGSYINTTATSEGAYNMLTTLTMNGQNAYLPASAQFSGTFKLSEFLEDMPRLETANLEDQYFIIGGIDGKIGEYNWELHGQHSHSLSTVANANNINQQNLYAAMDATVNPATNQIVCRASLTNSAYASCVPINLFGPTAVTAAAAAYITQRTAYTVNNGMDDIAGSLSGSPFQDWAGPVTMALSAEWRNTSLAVSSTAHPTDLANCTSIALNCTATTKLFLDSTLANLPTVNDGVYEFAYEVDAPLLKNLPLAQDVSLNGAIRYTNYSTSGGVVSWKAGLVWQVDDEWKLRGTRSRDIRAPNLYELFQPQTVSINATTTDLLTQQTATGTSYGGGNPNLKPEAADTTTFGFVYQPKWAPGHFTLSTDAYYIDIHGAIISESGTGTGQTNCYVSGGASIICGLQTRPFPITNTTPANNMTSWTSQPVNFSDFTAYGVDFDASETISILNNPFNLRGLVTWQPHVVTTTPGVAATDSAGGAQVSLGGGPAWAQPVLRVSLISNYKIGDFNIGVQERWRSRLAWTPDSSLVYAPTTGVGPQKYTDLNMSYTLHHGSIGKTQIYLTIQNLLDTQPQPYAGNPQISETGLFGGFPLGDDALGRNFTLGFRFQH